MDAGVTKLVAVDVKAGDVITDFNGEAWEFRGLTNGPVSHGKIIAMRRGDRPADAREFFASVFPNLKIRAAN